MKGKFLKFALFVCLIFLLSPVFFYLISDGLSMWNRTKVNDRFYIGKIEGWKGNCLYNEKQNFVQDIRVAFWNADSLIVESNNGCFLIDFEKTEYNDQMEKFDCYKLDGVLKNGEIKTFLSK